MYLTKEVKEEIFQNTVSQQLTLEHQKGKLLCSHLESTI